MDFSGAKELQDFKKRYNVTTSGMKIRGRDFQFFVPASIEEFINMDVTIKDFPLWVKIWEPSLVLAHEVSGIQPEPNAKLLEVGCGIGVVGIIASAFGHHVTMTEYNLTALDFANANAILNLGPGKKGLHLMRLDWRSPELEGIFDHIVGSEIIYREKDFPYLMQLFKRYLSPDGQIILACGIRKTVMKFLDEMKGNFKLSIRKITLRSQVKEMPLLLVRARYGT